MIVTFQKVICVSMLWAVAAGTLLAAARERPNVLIFLVDDVGGLNDLQSYGNTRSRTPYLDRLRGESVRLTNFHVAPMCTPTRAALLTGRDALDSQASMVNCGRSIPRPDLPMIQELFKADGYATGMFGKWHLGENEPFRPSDRGFEETLYFPGSSLGTARDYWNNMGWDCTVLHNNVRKKYPGFITEVWHDEAITWMRKQKESKRPFFCYMPSNLVHGPEFVEEAYKEPYRKRREHESIARIYGALERYDGLCARVDAFLEKEGLRENTIVIFFVDNGLCDATAHLYNAGLRGYKKSYYEGGHRVPCFIRWPKRGWQGGRDFEALTEVQDLFPTLIEACGVEPVIAAHPSGTSLVRLLDNKPMPELADRICFVQYGDYDPKTRSKGPVLEGVQCGPVYGKAAVLWREWRLVHDTELYDLKSDYSQTNNVAGAHPEIVSKLKHAYRQWWERLEPDKRGMVHIPVGLNAEPVLLDVSCWDGAWIDFSNAIRSGQRVNGPWSLDVVKEGEYCFDLRRWPQELGLPMTAPAPAGDWPYEQGKALPITKARIDIQGQIVERDVSSTDTCIRVTLKLKPGKTQLKTAFLDQKGEVISGIYYVDVTFMPTGRLPFNSWKHDFKDSPLIPSGLLGPASAATPQAVAVVDARAFSTDERLTALCLQGLLNREGAKLFLNFGGSVDTTQLRNDLGPTGPLWGAASFAALTNRFDSLYDIWLDELTKTGLLRFHPADLGELLHEAQKRGIVKGAVLYAKVDDDLAVAANYGALHNAVPTTSAVYEKWVKGKGFELPVIFDVRTLYPSYMPKEPKRIEAHRWALTNLFPKCDHSAAFSRDRTYGLDAHDTLIDIDLAVQQQYFIYNLNHLSPETRNPGDRPHPTYGFDLPDGKLVASILGGLKPFSMVYGWGSPDENNFARRASLHDCAVICTLNGNGSFFRKLPVLSPSFAQPHRRAGQVKLEQKIYVTFMVNEGDSLKSHATLGNQAGWMQPERGQIPINWGMDGYLYETFPGLVSYYYATATTNDYFFAPPSGWGYAHPSHMATNSLLPYARKVAEAGRKAEQSYIDIWWMGNLKEKGLLYPFLRETGMRGLTQWSDRQAVEYSPLDGTPVIHSYDYYTLLMGDPQAFAETLIREAKQVAPPWFIVVYGGWPYKFYEVARRLPADKFKVVLLDEFFEAARLARPQVEGRVWRPSDLKKAAAPGAGEAQTP